jgi:hypothetical protein
MEISDGTNARQKKRGRAAITNIVHTTGGGSSEPAQCKFFRSFSLILNGTDSTLHLLWRASQFQALSSS